MDEEAYLKMKEEEKGLPIVRTWFKHKVTGEYEYRIDVLEMNDYDEVNEK